MNWQTISSREKLSLMIGATALIAWAFWSIIYAPMANQSEVLARELQQYQSIEAELSSIQSQLQSLPSHRKVSSKDAGKLIRQRFQSKIISFITESENSTSIQLAPMTSDALFQNLLMLKNQHGLVVTYALLTENNQQISAKLTIQHP